MRYAAVVIYVWKVSGRCLAHLARARQVFGAKLKSNTDGPEALKNLLHGIRLT